MAILDVMLIKQRQLSLPDVEALPRGTTVPFTVDIDISPNHGVHPYTITLDVARDVTVGDKSGVKKVVVEHSRARLASILSSDAEGHREDPDPIIAGFEKTHLPSYEDATALANIDTPAAHHKSEFTLHCSPSIDKRQLSVKVSCIIGGLYSQSVSPFRYKRVVYV